jgi:Lipopolysaccharide kinase (Kdo/WaaP) family
MCYSGRDRIVVMSLHYAEPSRAETAQLERFSSEEFIPSQQTQRVKDALGVVTEISRRIGNDLPVMQMPPIDELDTTPGVYVIGPTQNTSDITEAHFIFSEMNLSGAADSAHAAIPGDLVVSRSDGSETGTTVVAKCFTKRDIDDRLTRVKRELTTMQAMTELGMLTINPIAVAMADTSRGRQVVLLTRHNPALTTMDNLPWARGINDRNNLENAMLGAAALARFNASGFLHGDAKVKNIAQTEEEEVGMIDYETSIPIDENDPQDAEKAAFLDLGQYLSSIVKKGLLGPKGSKIASATLRQDLLEPVSLAYACQWLSANQDVRDAVWQGTKSAVDAVLPNARKSTGWYSV